MPGKQPIRRDTPDQTPDPADDADSPDGSANAAETAGPDVDDVDLSPTLPNPPINIDINTAQPARMGDYLLGGGANFTVDREVTDYITDPLPGGTDTARTVVQATSEFQERVVRYLADDRGIRQYLNFRTRLPTGPKVHETAQQIAPESRVAYVFDDDVSLAHAHRLAKDTPAGRGEVTYVRGQLHDTGKLLQQVTGMVDFEQPVALLVFGALVAIDDDDAAYNTVAELLDAVVSGSYLAITHITGDLLGDRLSEPVDRLDQMITEGKLPPMTLRTKGQVLRFFDGLELVAPGVVPVDQWQPDAPPASPSEATGPSCQ